MCNSTERYGVLEEYLRLGESERAEKSRAWRAAIGLQDVDGLPTSDYLLETAKEHIEGRIDITAAQQRVQAYYEAREARTEAEEDTREGDLVSSRIAGLLAEKTFKFSPAELQSVHRRLFAGILDTAGEYRTYNITKKEWVLRGESVYYAAWDSIRETLDYDFAREKEFSYKDLAAEESVKHIAGFTVGLWQIHPFCEGNTRTVAVFMLRYLRTFGFVPDNEIFAQNSWYFRNALVRANYNDHQAGIYETGEYLEKFFGNLLLGRQAELKNRYLHVDYAPAASDGADSGAVDLPSSGQSANGGLSKCQNVTLEEMLVLRELQKHPEITQKELAAWLGVSERTIKRRTVELQEKGCLKRANGKRRGKWIVVAVPD